MLRGFIKALSLRGLGLLRYSPGMKALVGAIFALPLYLTKASRSVSFFEL